MTLKEKMAEVRAEIATAKAMLERRLAAAVEEYEHTTGEQVHRIDIASDGYVSVSTRDPQS